MNHGSFPANWVLQLFQIDLLNGMSKLTGSTVTTHNQQLHFQSKPARNPASFQGYKNNLLCQKIRENSNRTIRD